MFKSKTIWRKSSASEILTLIRCVIQARSKSEEKPLPPTKMMEAEGQQWPCKTDFYMQLPKVELHAHLNGSISASTMKKLIAKKPHLNVHSHMTMIDKGKKRTLEECFQMFQVIHQLTTNAEDILMVRHGSSFRMVWIFKAAAMSHCLWPFIKAQMKMFSLFLPSFFLFSFFCFAFFLN